MKQTDKKPKKEIKILKLISEDNDKDKQKLEKHCCIELFDHCEYKLHHLLIFPFLGKSLYDFLEFNEYQPFLSNDLKQIAQQILTAASYYKYRYKTRKHSICQ